MDMYFKAEITENFIPADNDKPILLTLKFKKEFIAARREKEQSQELEVEGQPAQEVKQLQLDQQMSSQVTEEETKQGNITSLGSNNAEVFSDPIEGPNNSTEVEKETDNSKQNQSTKIEEVNQDIEMDTDQKVEGVKSVTSAIAPEVTNTLKQSDVQMRDSEESKEQVEPEDEQTQQIVQEESEVAQHSETQTGSDNTKDQVDEVNLLCDDEKMSDTSTPSRSQNIGNGNKYELLDDVFNLILSKNKNDEVNPVLSGYFKKIILGLLSYKQKEMMSYIYTKETLMEKLLNHVYDNSICDVIIKILNISNSEATTNNNNITNDSGEIFGASPRRNSSVREDSMNLSTNYEASRNEIIHKLIDRLIRAKNVEEYWNCSSILCEMAKFSQLFEFLTSPEIMDKISIGLENKDEEGIKHTLRLYNTILVEYCKDGTNKRVNISALDEDDEFNDGGNDMMSLALQMQQDELKEPNSITDKSGDQSGSNLSRSINFKENEKERQFMENIANVLPLIIQLISDDVNQKYIDCSYQPKIQAFGGMKLEAVEMIRLITSKFCVNLKEDLIKCNTFTILLSLFEAFPNNSMLHSKIEEIIKFSLKNGGDEIIEEIMYKTQLIKYILDLSRDEKKQLTFTTTQNQICHGYFAYVINIANELLKLSLENSEISNTLESIPEWGKFQKGLLKEHNEVLEGPLGGRDPRTKIESLFDDNDFLCRFDSIKKRRNQINNKVEDEIEQEQEHEEEEEEEEDKLQFEDINRYFDDGAEQDDEQIDHPKGRYDTIDIDDEDMDIEGEDYIEDEEDDVNQKGLEWQIDPVRKESDDEKLIDENIADVAMEFIQHRRNKKRNELNSDLQIDGVEIKTEKAVNEDKKEEVKEKNHEEDVEMKASEEQPQIRTEQSIDTAYNSKPINEDKKEA